jgi:hypothetical protein
LDEAGMKGRTYVMRRGRLVLKRREQSAGNAKVHVISDDLGAQLEHHGYADGRKTDSKSTFRRWTKDAGLVEKGNDRERPKRASAQDIASDVATALQMCKDGYRPRIRFEGGDGSGWH